MSSSKIPAPLHCFLWVATFACRVGWRAYLLIIVFAVFEALYFISVAECNLFTETVFHPGAKCSAIFQTSVVYAPSPNLAKPSYKNSLGVRGIAFEIFEGRGDITVGVCV